jgi:hypothetical protein
MNEKRRYPKLLIIILLLVPVLVFAVRATGKASNRFEDMTEKWEYLAVQGGSGTNFSPTGNPDMKKEVSSSFAREGFVLEQHLDKLGAKGWELVSVSGQPNDPVYYFKRRK